MLVKIEQHKRLCVPCYAAIHSVRTAAMVERRSVFFISGYDPRGYRFYRNLFFRESRKQAEVAGYGIETENISRNHWRIEFCEEEKKTVTDYHFLDYTDLILSEWSRNELALFRDFIGFYSNMLLTPMGWRCMKHNPPSVIAASYPIMVSAILFLLLAVLITLIFSFSPLSVLLNAGIVVGVFMLLIIAGRMIDKKLNHYWILRSIAFLGADRYESNPLFEKNMQSFLDSIEQSVDEEKPDEVLIIGHSVGSALAIEVAHELLERNSPIRNVCLITLGACYHYKATNRKSVRFRGIVDRLMEQNQIDWIDIAAYADGASVCQVHPKIALSGREPEKFPALPRLYHSRFFKCFSAEGYQELKKDPLRLHFQYLRATEHEGPYDYFRMVSGYRFINEIYS